MRPVEFRASVLLSVLGLLIVSCSGRSVGPGSKYRTVRPGVAFEMLRDNLDLVVLDLRPFGEYSAAGGHLERALSAPVAELDELWPSLELSAEDTVLLYNNDGGPMQGDSSTTLIERGLRYVVQIDGGLDAWVAGGFPVYVEDAPLSRRRSESPRRSTPQ